MPRTPRNSPNPPGRPPKAQEAANALQRAARTGESIESAAKAEGVNASTVHAHKAKRGAGKGATAARPSASAPSRPPGPSSPPAGSQAPALPQGGAVSGRPELLALVRRILDARNGAARAELDEGLVVAARGEQELAAWLARPPEVPELQGDELDALEGALARLLSLLDRAGPDAGPRIALAKAIDSVSKSLSVVRLRRPAEDKPDEVTRRLAGIRDKAIERVGILTSDAAVKFAADRAALAARLTAIGPIGVDLLREVDAMLGGPIAA